MKSIFFLTTIICSVVVRSIRLKPEYHGKGEKLKEFPFAVSIRQYECRFSRHFYGGFVYSSKWIVTTASCVEGKSADTLEVVVGQQKRTHKQRSEQTIGVSRVFIYDDISVRGRFYKYVAKASRILELLNINILHKFVTIPNDAALVQLSSDIKFHDDGNSTTTPDPSKLKVVYFVGIGSVVPHETDGTAVLGCGKYIRNELDSINVYMLLYFPVDITEALVCDGYRLFDRSTMICAIPKAVATVGSPCYIDKGYPLVQENSNGHLNVVGIMSHQSCSLDSPSVFTRLGKLYPWFEQTAGYRI